MLLQLKVWFGFLLSAALTVLLLQSQAKLTPVVDLKGSQVKAFEQSQAFHAQLATYYTDFKIDTNRSSEHKTLRAAMKLLPKRKLSESANIRVGKSNRRGLRKYRLAHRKLKSASSFARLFQGSRKTAFVLSTDGMLLWRSDQELPFGKSTSHLSHLAFFSTALQKKYVTGLWNVEGKPSVVGSAPIFSKEREILGVLMVTQPIERQTFFKNINRSVNKDGVAPLIILSDDGPIAVGAATQPKNLVNLFTKWFKANAKDVIKKSRSGLFFSDKFIRIGGSKFTFLSNPLPGTISDGRIRYILFASRKKVPFAAFYHGGIVATIALGLGLAALLIALLYSLSWRAGIRKVGLISELVYKKDAPKLRPVDFPINFRRFAIYFIRAQERLRNLRELDKVKSKKATHTRRPDPEELNIEPTPSEYLDLSGDMDFAAQLADQAEVIEEKPTYKTGTLNSPEAVEAIEKELERRMNETKEAAERYQPGPSKSPDNSGALSFSRDPSSSSMSFSRSASRAAMSSLSRQPSSVSLNPINRQPTSGSRALSRHPSGIQPAITRQPTGMNSALTRQPTGSLSLSRQPSYGALSSPQAGMGAPMGTGQHGQYNGNAAQYGGGGVAPAFGDEIDSAFSNIQDELTSGGGGSLSQAPAQPNQQSEGDEFSVVFQRYLAVRRECGEPIDNISFDKFSEQLKRQKETILRQYHCQNVLFEVYTKNGLAAIKARPVS